ncbi:MAG: hypothetical protein FD144_4789 [Rhodospirillaceae bacterium]|nr:MAG: hypothetical protein FD144_4789 [Rhodospirillaceae bacterium]
MLVAPSRSFHSDPTRHASSPFLLRPPACEVLVEDLDRGVERRMRRSRPHVVQRVTRSPDDSLRLSVGENTVFLEPNEELEYEGPCGHPERANRNRPALRPTLPHDRLPFPQQSAVDPRRTNRRPPTRRCGAGANAYRRRLKLFALPVRSPNCPARDALNLRSLRDERALHAHLYGGVDVQEVGPGVQAYGI